MSLRIQGYAAVFDRVDRAGTCFAAASLPMRCRCRC